MQIASRAKLLIAAAGVVLAGSAAPAAACVMTAAERTWIDSALQASDQVMVQRLRLARDRRPTIILFDDRCRFEARGAAGGRWIATPHRGKIRLPDGKQIDAGVTAFASRVENTGERFFVMALPSLWYAANAFKPGDRLGLTGVFLHEFSHTRQMDVLQPRFEAAEAIYKMPDDFGDDSVQKHFQADPAYVAVAEKETALLYRAAREPDAATARGLARQALQLIEARQRRWFVGEDSRWKAYDDIFLTMEGFGQWAGYAWLSDPQGGAMAASEAEAKMRGSRRWWSQEQGLALFLVIDRFVPNWAEQAFGSPPALGIDLLRQAVAE